VYRCHPSCSCVLIVSPLVVTSFEKSLEISLHAQWSLPSLYDQSSQVTSEVQLRTGGREVSHPSRGSLHL
jgi:hypothetical protein